MDLSPQDAMQPALDQAEKAMRCDEVPVGAALYGPEGDLIAQDHDRRMELRDPTAHAEILVMRVAAQALGDWRLERCRLYVTLEPCPMCAGAILMARIEKVIYGAPSHKSGAVETHLRLLDIATFNHRVEVESGVRAEECSALLSRYFKTRR